MFHVEHSMGSLSSSVEIVRCAPLKRAASYRDASAAIQPAELTHSNALTARNVSRGTFTHRI